MTEPSLFRRMLIAPIRAYRRWLSPMLPPSCRYEPSCSVYTMQAIELHGVRGLWLGLLRILRCQPFFPGGYDPVPGWEEHRHGAGGCQAPSSASGPTLPESR